MRPRGGPAARAVLRAGLLGAGVVGGYFLLSLFAGPAHADSGDDGTGLGGLLGGASLPVVGSLDEPAVPPDQAAEQGESPELAAPAEPVDDVVPEPAVDVVTEPVADIVSEPVAEVVTEPVADLVEQAAPTVDNTTDAAVALTETVGTTADLTDTVTDTVTDAVAGTAVAPLVETVGESVDELVASAGGTVGSTVDPLTSTVDALLPGIVAPVVDDVTDPPLLDQPLTTLPPSPLAEPVAVVDGAPQLGIGPPAAVAAAIVEADPPGEVLGPPSPPLLVPAILDLGGQVPDTAAAVTAADGGDDPSPARAPRPLPASSTHQLAGNSFDPGHPWPWTGPPTAAHEPDPVYQRCLEDIAYSWLVMSVSAPPG